MRLVQKQDAINWDAFMPNSSTIDWEQQFFFKNLFDVYQTSNASKTT